MSDAIKHECGIALIRLLKPLDYYLEKYGTALYGLNKLYLLMEKQHNRGQDGAGAATIKLDMGPGRKYLARKRSNKRQPIIDLFEQIFAPLDKIPEDKYRDTEWLKQNIPFVGEVLLGHLRYGTHGDNSIEACHPFLRQNNWITRNLILSGNFNMTNANELFEQLVEIGQHPKAKEDTVTVLEKVGHFLDVENEHVYNELKEEGYSKIEATEEISKRLDVSRVLTRAVKDFDGGYAITGLLGHGDSFVLRDPHGIRPAYWYADDEVVVVASERPPIQTAFNVPLDKIKEVTPGHALIIRKDGTYAEHSCAETREKTACSFERIYFSRGNDKDIYTERKRLGYTLTDRILERVDHDLKKTVFSFIPNTAETAFYGLINGVEDYLNGYKKEKIKELEGDLDPDKLEYLLSYRPRVEKISIKDAKLRTFITEDSSRNDLVAHVYDITYGAIKRGEDNLVIVDDSIVRGTTLEKSILRILDRLGPKKIVVVSSAPQIRYPDCYGIDMSKMKDFIAFRAAIALLEERGEDGVLDEIYAKCIEQQDLPAAQVTNQVKLLYDKFTPEEISDKIAEIVGRDIKAEVEIVYQSIEGLHEACPDHSGDWYFTGNFPTPGGNQVVNRAFMNYMERKDVRAY